MRRDRVVFAAVEEPDVVHAVARRDTLGAKPYSRTSLRRGGTDAATTSPSAAATRVHIRLIVVRAAVDPVDLLVFLCVDD
jgi:hypothetical protein